MGFMLLSEKIITPGEKSVKGKMDARSARMLCVRQLTGTADKAVVYALVLATFV